VRAGGGCIFLDRTNRVVMPAHSRSKNGVASLAYAAGIHVFDAGQAKTWMAGTSPAMTRYRGNLDSLGALWMSAAANVLYLPAPADVAKW
jgi:hypothetical protein